MRHERNSEVLGATVWDELEVLGLPKVSEDAAFHFENLESHVSLRKALSCEMAVEGLLVSHSFISRMGKMHSELPP